jgi:cytochrome oxidase Cu insertion factor (SCO1/SenC/PrrC family)
VRCLLLLSSLCAAAVPVAAAFELSRVPEAALIDQDGRRVRFRADLVLDRLVAINFIFTRCTTLCPPMGAVFAQLRQELHQRGIDGVRLLSVSIDPGTDTPARLKAWAERFGATPEWTLLTGAKSEVDRLLKQLGVFTALKEDHAPILLLGDAAIGRWTRITGLATPERLAGLLEELHRARVLAARADAPAPVNLAAREYFTDLTLIDQDGQARRFYGDLIQGKKVIISAFFGDCEASCPVIQGHLAQIQAMLGARLGDDVHLLSISVDPDHDTPARLAAYGRRLHARPGWFFLTGTRDNVARALSKLGQYVEQRESHTSILLLGNDRTGLWKKAFAFGPPEELLAVVRSVIDDPG